MGNPTATRRAIGVVGIDRRGTGPAAVARAQARYQSTSGSAATGAVARVLGGLGYVPLSELTPLSSQAASLQSQVSAAQAQVASLTSQVSALQSQSGAATANVSSLSSQLSSLNGQIGAAQSALASLQSQLAALTAALNQDDAQVQSLTTQLQNLQGQIATLQSAVQSDQASIASLTSQLQGLQGAVGSYNAVSGSAALVSAPNETDGDPTYDPPYSGFAPYPATFGTASVGLVTAAAPSTHAVRYQAASPASGGLIAGLASSLGYVPASSVTTESGQVAALQAQLAQLNAQIASLQSQSSTLTATLQSAQSQAASLGSQVAAAQSSLAGLNSQISSTNAQIASAQSGTASATSSASSLGGQVASAQASVSTLTGQHQTNLAQISSLGGQVSTWQGYLSAIQSGNLPVSFAWSYGDGSPTDTTSGASPTHTYLSAGSYLPSVTVTVTRPDGTVLTETFGAGGVIVGQWPTAINVSGGGGETSGYINFYLTDAGGNPVPNCRVVVRSSDVVGWPTGGYTVVTDATGKTQPNLNYSTPGHATGTCLRNPSLSVTSGLANL
jgi:peptidoglycan hydrolase CwlO-like protein